VDRINNNALLFQFAKRNSFIASLKGRNELFMSIMKQFNGVPVTYLEFGVFEGESIKMIASLNDLPESRFIGFDSFNGLPETWFKVKKGGFDADGKIPVVSDKRISFVKGLFQDTLPEFLKSFKIGYPLLVMLDADLYSSTLFVLTILNSFFTKETVIIFDEFNDPLGEFRAFSDFIKAYNKDFTPLYCVIDKGLLINAAFTVKT
jgi:hypothetical protein